MAFALALQSVTDLPDNHGRVLLTSTLFTIFFTVLLVGGTTPLCLTYLKIEMTRSSQSGGHGEEEANEPMPATTRIDTPVESSDEETPEGGDLGILERQKAKLQKKLRKLKKEYDVFPNRIEISAWLLAFVDLISCAGNYVHAKLRQGNLQRLKDGKQLAYTRKTKELTGTGNLVGGSSHYTVNAIRGRAKT
ncbi:hypothetical protein R1flu_024742 [Riccia fluitans]|uniref:Uncharacterized protein n=1 Tax=Riccia fluitans TaxID=41844 RepID=A0ABD1XVS7_9MARC